MVGKEPLPHPKGFGGDRLAENGVFHGIGRQPGQVFRRGVVAGAVQAVGVFVVGIGKPQEAGLVVHLLGEALHGAAAVDGQSHRRVVAGGQHKPIQQLLEGQYLPLPQVHGGTLDAHRLPGNPHPVQHVALLADDQGRHDFGSAGHEGLPGGILFKEHPPGDPIQKAGLPGGQTPGPLG